MVTAGSLFLLKEKVRKCLAMIKFRIIFSLFTNLVKKNWFNKIVQMTSLVNSTFWKRSSFNFPKNLEVLGQFSRWVFLFLWTTSKLSISFLCEIPSLRVSTISCPRRVSNPFSSSTSTMKILRIIFNIFSALLFN